MTHVHETQHGAVSFPSLGAAHGEDGRFFDRQRIRPALQGTGH